MFDNKSRILSLLSNEILIDIGAYHGEFTDMYLEYNKKP